MGIRASKEGEMDEGRETLARMAAADENKKDSETKNNEDMRSYKKTYPDFSEVLKGRKITLREC